MENSYRIKVNGSFEYELKESDFQAIDILSTDPSGYHVLENNIPYHAKITESDFYQKSYTVKVNSGLYQVTISDDLDQLIDQMGFASSISTILFRAMILGWTISLSVRSA